MKIALTIAGSDSGGGAGIQADLKTFQMHRVFGTSAITAITAQNTTGVRSWEAVSPGLVAAQIEAVAEDLPPAAFKSGMLGSAEVVETVAHTVRRLKLPNYVLDTVMVATTGARLLDADAEGLVVDRLVPLATLVTPNLDEAEILVGTDVRQPEAMRQAGRALLRLGAWAALIKGGHLEGDTVVDVLVTRDGEREFRHPRIETTATHGTGCTLSAAITANLALGMMLEQAVEQGLDYVHRAIAQAPGLGSGKGPVGF